MDGQADGVARDSRCPTALDAMGPLLGLEVSRQIVRSDLNGRVLMSSTVSIVISRLALPSHESSERPIPSDPSRHHLQSMAAIVCVVRAPVRGTHFVGPA